LQPVRVPFGDYKPDLAKLVNDGLAVANNTVPITGGYTGINALSNVTAFTAIAERPRGAIAGIDAKGNPFNFVGTETKLYSLRTETIDATRLVGGDYGCSNENFWEFAAFDNFVMAVNAGDAPQYFIINSSDNFLKLGNPDLTKTVAPYGSSHIGIIDRFVVMGNTSNDPGEIHWSALNDPFNWPDPGSAVAGAVQSDRQALSGDGGAVQRVVSGAEVGVIFQERAVWRADYRGGDVIFELNRVEPNRGLLIPAIAIPFGRNVFYLSEDGFYLFNYTESIPIGRDIIDATFMADVDTSLFDRVSAVSDPDSQRIWILYPGAGHAASGTPNKYLCYDWGLNRWSHGEITAEWLTQTVQAGVHLDTAGSIGDPNSISDDPAFPDGGVDSGGLGSFDERQVPSGSLRLGAYSATPFRLQDFTGTGLAATLQTGRRELIPGSRSLASRVRIMIDGVNPTLEVAGLRRVNATTRFGPSTRIDEDGDAPCRKDGRYHVFKVKVGSGFSDALYMDVLCQRSGFR